MKLFFVINRIIIAIVLFLSMGILRAQEKIPAGFKKGTIMLPDSTVMAGYIRDYMRSNATLVFLSPGSGHRQQFDGNQLRAAEIEGTRFICRKGDFFRIISGGQVCLLQKCSDASARPVYNGTEAALINGTEGRRGDYFMYGEKLQDLWLLNNKTRVKVIKEVFAGDAVAMSRADAAGGDMSGIKAAVELHNNHDKQGQ